MTTRTTVPSPAVTPAREAEAVEPPAEQSLFLPVIVIAVLNSVLTASMVNVLLPDMKATFGASPAGISWVVTAYSLMYAIGIPLIGRMSDLFGARALFIGGLAGFAAGSAISVLAPSLPLLVLGRLIQGAGGAAVPALAMVLIARTMPEDRRGAAMGLVGSAAGTGAAAGPFVGALVGGSIGWRGLFLLPMLASLVIIPLVRKAIPDTRGSGGTLDLAGGALLGGAIGLFLFAITRGDAAGYGAFSTQASFLGAILATAVFSWRISTASSPFVPPRLFRNQAYMRLLAAFSFMTMAYMSALILVPLMLVDHNGLAATGAGLALTPGAVAVAIGSRHAGKLADRIGPRTPILVGLTILLVAAAAMSTFGAGASAWVVALGMLALGIANTLIIAPMNSAASRTLSPELTGIGMGLFSGISFLGGGIGAAITGTWLSARLRADAGALNPFYAGEAGPWSDAFAAAVVMGAISLLLAVRIQTRQQPVSGT